jgi:transcriptional regulator GlxA family with amidase domain
VVLDWLRARARSGELLLSVCTGALLLAAAGLLVDRRATTHHDAYDELTSLSPRTKLVTGRRVVSASARLRTSAGISAGIHAALGVVEELAGADLRQGVADEMEWMWEDQSG